MAFAQGNTYTTARLHFLLTKWILRRFRPFAIVEDPEIIEIFQMLHAPLVSRVHFRYELYLSSYTKQRPLMLSAHSHVGA